MFTNSMLLGNVLLSDALSGEALLWSVNVLVQITLICICGILMAAALRWRPAARYWVLSSALVLLLVAPLVAFVIQASGKSLLSFPVAEEPAVNSTIANPTNVAAATPMLRQGDLLVNGAPTINPLSFDSHQEDQVDESAASNAVPAKPEDSLAHPPEDQSSSVGSAAPGVGTVLQWLCISLAVVWAAGAVILLGRTLRATWKLAGVIRRATETDASETESPISQNKLDEMLHEIRGTLGTDAPLDVAFSSEIAGPVVVGIRRARILIPLKLLEWMTPTQLQAILAHEAAHVVRRDLTIVLLQQIARILFWFHPLIHMLNRRICQAREEVCDNHVLQTAQPTEHGRTLLQIAEGMPVCQPHAAALGALGSGWKLETRISGLFDARRNLAPKLSRKASIATVALAVVFATATACLNVGLGKTTSPEATPAANDVAPDTQQEPRQDDRAAQTGNPPAAQGRAQLPYDLATQLGTTRFRFQDSRPGNPSIMYSPDGKSLISVAGSEIRWWDSRTGVTQQTRSMEGLHQQQSAQSSDGKMLAVLGYRMLGEDGQRQQAVQIWNLLTAQRDAEITWSANGSETYEAIACSPDGKRVIIGSNRGKLQVLDVASGKWVLESKLPGPVDAIGRLAVAADGTQIAIAARQAFTWSGKDGDDPKPIAGYSNIYAVAFHPTDSNTLAFVGSSAPAAEGRAIVWDIAKSAAVHEFRAPELPAITTTQIAFSPDGKSLVVPNSAGASYSRDDNKYNICVWQLESGELLRRIKTGGLRPIKIALSRDGKLCAVIDQCALNVWNLESGEQYAEVPESNESVVSSISFAADDKSLVTGGEDGTCRLWEISTGDLKQTQTFGKRVRGVAVSKDAKWIAASSTDDSVRLFEHSSGKEVHRWQGHGSLGGRRELQFTPDSKRLASWGDADMTVRVWDVATGDKISEAILMPDGADYAAIVKRRPTLLSAEFTADAARIVVSVNGAVYVFDCATGAQVKKIEREGQKYVDVVASPDGKHALTVYPKVEPTATMSPPYVYTMIDTTDGSSRWDFELDAKSVYMTISPDARLIAILALSKPTSFFDAREVVIFLNAETGEQLAEFAADNFIGFGNGSIAFSQDGKSFAAPLRDSTVLVWKLSDLGITLN